MTSCGRRGCYVCHPRPGHGILAGMSPIVRELDARLHALDARTARMVEQLVRDALQLASEKMARPGGNVAGAGWPDHYFERTAGALAGETFERPPQGSPEERETW